MKTQTFLVVMQDLNGIEKDFYRFSYKKADTVKRDILKALSGINSDFWIHNWSRDNVVKIVCYATPDGYNRGPVAWEIFPDFVKAVIQ